ncbi:hypothetical protein, partial [Vibrio parahaemolyticus]|uniref:hypothetical protein n=1 Tax=Vibrio parahaemolyticus TaxID=670 RepID=UPI001BAEE1F6
DGFFDLFTRFVHVARKPLDIVVNHLKNIPLVFMVKLVGYQVGYQKNLLYFGVSKIFRTSLTTTAALM